MIDFRSLRDSGITWKVKLDVGLSGQGGSSANRVLADDVVLERGP